MSRATFTFRLDDDLVSPLTARVEAGDRSRNWVINQAVRDLLSRPAADETPVADEAGVHKTRDTARAASAGTVQGAQPPRPVHKPEAPQATQTPPPDGAGVDARAPQNAPQPPAGPHRHRFTAEVPGKRRGIQGVIYATYRCDGCEQTLERKAPK